MSFIQRFTDSVSQFVEQHPNSIQLTLTAVAASALTASSILTFQANQRKSRARTLKDELKEAELRSTIDLTPVGTVNKSGQPHILPPPTVFDDRLIEEQLSKNTAFLGQKGADQVRDAFVIVVGAGGVGSWAALMLMRSGVKRIRIIDFDQVTLSSLNRHAVATLEDVGTPKVRCIKTHFKQIAPFVEVEDCIDLLNADNVDELLSGNPDYVIDAIDNINTKIDLIKYCHDKKLPVISSMGAGAKADPSRIQIADISETFEDPLARSVRQRLKKLGILNGVPVAYSTEKPHHVKLLPLEEEKIEDRDEFSAMSNYTTFIEESPPPIDNDPEEIGYTSTFWIGLGVSVITNLIQAFALSFQRKSHLLNDLLPRELRRSAYKRPMWLFAFLSFLFANTVGSIFSIGYLPIVILAPIGAMNLVFNAFAANIVLGDPLSKQSILGTAFIALGALLVGFFGVIPEPNHSLSDLIQLYKKSGFIIYFTILETVIAALMLVTHYLEYRCVQIELKEEMEHKKIHGYPLADLKRWIGISYGILSGNVSSQSMLFAKSGIELIIISIASQENQLQYPLTWFLLVMMILTGGLQLFYLNKGLRLCDTMILIPLSFCAFNVSCLFNGLVYYNQWHRFEVWQLVNVIFGVVVTVFGVLLLSWQQEHKSGADEIGTLHSETDRLVAAVDEDGFDGEQIVYAEEDYDDDEDGDQDYALNNSQVNLLVKKKKSKKTKHPADTTVNGSIHL